MAMRMLAIALEEAPLLFENAGPGCVRGKCPEGEMSCGQQEKVKDEISKLHC